MKSIAMSIAIMMLVCGCAHSVSPVHIQEKAVEFKDVDAFAAWLDEQPGIWRVKVEKQLLLTTMPPRVAVTYYRYGARSELLLQVEPDRKLKLVKPE